MPPKENKTADKKSYQAQYRKDHPKSKEDQKEYMKKYISEAVSVECPVCKAAGLSGSFRSYNKYKHDATQKHQEAEKILKAKHELKKREEEEEAAQKKALEEAKPKRTIKIKKKKTEPKKAEPKKEENIKMEIKEKPVPAPRKKKVEEKALEEYASSSDEEKEEEEKLEDIKFKFQGKVINSEEVAKYIQEHHEGSANPARSAESKTPRLNKNASLWRKVAKELDGKKWTELGNNFGQIVSKAYDKPSSQADLVQMLKQVVIHFTKVPVPEQKRISMLARKLKTSHVSNQK